MERIYTADSLPDTNAPQGEIKEQQGVRESVGEGEIEIKCFQYSSDRLIKGMHSNNVLSGFYQATEEQSNRNLPLCNQQRCTTA